MAALRARIRSDPADGEAALEAGWLSLVHGSPLGDPQLHLRSAARAPGLRQEALLLTVYARLQRQDLLGAAGVARELLGEAPGSPQAAAAALMLERAEPLLSTHPELEHRRWLAALLDRRGLHPDARRSLVRQLGRACARAKDAACVERARRRQGFVRAWTAHGPVGLTPLIALRETLSAKVPTGAAGCVPAIGPAPLDVVCTQPVFGRDGLVSCPTWGDRGGGCLLATRILIGRSGWTELGVQTDDAVQVEIDGVRVLVHDPIVEGAEGRVRLVRLHLAAGWHRVRVALVSEGWRHGLRLWLTGPAGGAVVQRTDPEQSGSPAAVRSPGAVEPAREPSVLAWLGRRSVAGDSVADLLLATLLGPGALHEPLRRMNAARRLAEAWPVAAEAKHLEAESLLGAPDLASGARQSRARAAYGQALRLDPGHKGARLGLARLEAAASPATALSHLEALLSSVPSHPTAWVERFVVERALGRDRDAAASLARGLSLWPGPDAANEAVSWRGERRSLQLGQQARQRLLDALPSLAPAQRAWWAEEAGAPELAIAHWQARGRHETLAVQPPSEVVRVARVLGATATRDSALREWERRAPGDPELAVALARARLQDGHSGAGRQALLSALRRRPHDLDLHRLLAELDGRELGVPDPLSARHHRSEPAERGAGPGAASPGAAVGAEHAPDREVLWQHRRDVLLGPWGGYRMVHRVLRVHTQAAADELGELRLPEESRLLVLRTVEGDGAVRGAELGQGKQDLSLSGLSAGDLIELRYLVPLLPTLPGGGVGDRFFFALPDAAVRAGLLEGCVPRAAELTTWSGPAPRPRELDRRSGPLSTTCRRWLAEAAPAVPPEPEHAPLPEWLPWLAYGVGVAALPLRLAATGEDRVARHTKVVDAVRRAAATWAAAAPDRRPGTVARALLAGVCGAVESNGAEWELATGAAQTLAAGRGNRTLLLAAALRAEGVEHRVLLADDRTAEQAGLPPGLLAGFRRPLIELTTAGQDSGLLLSAEVGAADVAAPLAELAGGHALVLGGPDVGSVIDLAPASAAAPPDWEVDLTLEVRSAGAPANGTLSVLASGPGAEVLRRFLRRVQPERLVPELERTLASVLPAGLRVDAVRHAGEEATLGSVHLELDLRVPRATQRASDATRARVLPLLRDALGPALGHPAAELGDYLGRQQRRTPLSLRPLREVQRIELRAPGATVDPLSLPSGEVDAEGLHCSQISRTLPTGGYVMERRVSTELRRVDPARFVGLRSALLRALQLLRAGGELAWSPPAAAKP